MHFFYFDAAAQLHSISQLSSLAQPLVDVDVSWLTLGHQVFPHRLHGLKCFERLSSEVPDDHQFSFKSWYDVRNRSTHCVWYSLPKTVLASLSMEQPLVKSMIFVLPRFFPPICRNKSVLCFVEVQDCELVAGYIQGHCVCFKKLPARSAIQVQHEWQYLQQAYPQWHFEHSIFLTAHREAEYSLMQTHQQTIHLETKADMLKNRMMLYGID